MSTEDNKAIVRRMYEEVMNKGNVVVVDELFAPHYVHNFDSSTNVSEPERFQQGREEFKQFLLQWRSAFPDLHYLVEFQVAEADLVVTHGTARGTHTGEYRGLEFKGIPPTGKPVAWTFTAIDRLANGKIVESWLNHDDVSRLQQIGALPTPGQAS
jgi:predicted ester cyclase